MTEEKMNWETIHSFVSHPLGSRERTSRARVPTGWLVKYVYRGGPDRSAPALTFIPDVEGTWVISNESARWEEVQVTRTPNDVVQIWRLKVPGGWLVRDGTYIKDACLTMSMVFVPDANHIWVI